MGVRLFSSKLISTLIVLSLNVHICVWDVLKFESLIGWMMGLGPEVEILNL